jgi:hypothetical protein
MFFINTVATGKVNAPMYRIGGKHYLVIMWVRDARGVFKIVDRFMGTRSSVAASRNTAVASLNLA